MSATTENLIRELCLRGVRFLRIDNTLRITAPRGTVTPAIRRALANAKPAILELVGVAEIRSTLEKLANEAEVELAVVRSLDSTDLLTCANLDEAALRSYLQSIRDTQLRERGEVPLRETAKGICCSCGPIWLAPEVAACAPIIDGYPRVLGCPWCHIRIRGLRIPHP